MVQVFVLCDPSLPEGAHKKKRAAKQKAASLQSDGFSTTLCNTTGNLKEAHNNGVYTPQIEAKLCEMFYLQRRVVL